MEIPQLVAILNITPDSFSDGGSFVTRDQIQQRIHQITEEGADWIDVGGEASGPGSQYVSQQEELDRVLPAIEIIKKETNLKISIDTSKAEVARQSLHAGATMINDVTGFRRDPQMMEVLIKTQCLSVWMHSKDSTPRTSHLKQDYEDILATITSFFEERINTFEQRGGHRNQMILDPGLGFFLSGYPHYSFEVIARLGELKKLGCPLFIGTSRKSFLAHLSSEKNLSPQQRDIPSAITSAVAIWNGASYIRMHHVAYGRMVIDTLKHLMPFKSTLPDPSL